MRAEVLTVFQIILQDAIFNCLIVVQSRDWDFLSKNKDLSMSVNSKANDFKVILGIHPWTLKLCFCLLLFCCFFLCYLISFNPLSKIKQGCLKIEKFIFNTVLIWFKLSYVDLFLHIWYVEGFYCMKNVQIRSFFWCIFFRIWTEYSHLLCKSPYSVQIIRTRKNSVFGHFIMQYKKLKLELVIALNQKKKSCR